MIRPACVPEHYLEADGCADAGGTLAATSRFGTRPTFSRLTSRRAFPSMIETSSLPALLTQTYLPSGEKATQFGPLPVGTRATIFCDLTS